MPYGPDTVLKQIRAEIIFREIRKKTVSVGTNFWFSGVAYKFYSLPQKESRTTESSEKACQKTWKDFCARSNYMVKASQPWREYCRGVRKTYKITSGMEKGNRNKLCFILLGFFVCF